jgi:hypothetical protein
MPTVSRRRRTLTAALALSPLTITLPTFAQTSLPKTLTLLVPQAAGGSNDVMARAVAARLSRVLGATPTRSSKTARAPAATSAPPMSPSRRPGTAAPGWSR